eukprot:5147368-Pleurochrysis_carterae.AAC.6
MPRSKVQRLSNGKSKLRVKYIHRKPGGYPVSRTVITLAGWKFSWAVRQLSMIGDMIKNSDESMKPKDQIGDEYDHAGGLL